MCSIFFSYRVLKDTSFYARAYVFFVDSSMPNYPYFLYVKNLYALVKLARSYDVFTLTLITFFIIVYLINFLIYIILF